MSIERLTPRELEVVRLQAATLTNLEIADALGISVKTVENYACMIYRKLNVRGRMAAARIWWEHENGLGGGE